MQTRSFIPLVVAAAVSAGAGFWFGRQTPETVGGTPSSSSVERKVKFYQSPMHPWIVSDTPGRCTICGMDLVPVYEGESGIEVAHSVKLNARSAGVVGVQTEEVKSRPLQRSLRVNGVFEVDHTRHRVLSARVPGRIETLHIDQVGIRVEKDAPLATLYSPEILSAQRVYLERLISGPDAISSSQLAEARERLLDLGATAEDISRLEQTRQPEAILTVRAPFAGTVIRRGERAFAGAYVEEADTLFELGDLDQMWFIFEAYETDLAVFETGQTVTIFPAQSGSDPFFAPIAFIDPNLDPVTRTADIRVVVANPDYRWRHQQTARAEVTVDVGEHLSVPRSAVLFTRQQPVVFEKLDEQTYLPREVELGAVGDGFYAIRGGLTEGARVVTEAALLLESQAQLNSPPSIEASTSTMTMDADTDIAALRPLIFAAADAAAALAADDLNAYIETLPRLHEGWSGYVDQTPDAEEGPLNEMIMALSDGPTLTAAREPFEPFSTAVADLAKQAGLHRSDDINIFQCPMTPVLGTGRWVQRDADLRNPFFGAEMLNCGTPIR
ncbi:MAG: hypothetical protein SynsKO_11640 [Synoicihabitans sp.]